MDDKLEELLRSLRNVLVDRAILNTQRLLILVALYLSGKLVFIDLVRITGIDKGKLEYHLSVLEEEGLIRRRRHLTLIGPRLYIEITCKGERILEQVIEALTNIIKDRRNDK